MSARQALAEHWPEYLIEALALVLFMIAACACVGLLQYPASPLYGLAADPWLRRSLIGLCMGLTAIAIIYSPWGKRSGAHLNPSVTLTFYLLGKIRPWDALFYVLFQFAGGIAGVLLARLVLSDRIVGSTAVNYVLTLPGVYGTGAAFAAETSISFGLMMTVLACSNNHRLNRYTGLFAGTLVAAYISLEAPISGMSMNPARSFGSALSALDWTSLWLYFSAPPLGMLLAAESYRRINGADSILCCKLHHENNQRCIFRCRYRRGDRQDAGIGMETRTLEHEIRETHMSIATSRQNINEAAATSLAAAGSGAANAVVCPACGGENPADAVFCGNHHCRKALGEFRYVLEELSAQKNWIEKLADRVTLFVSTPHFITLHVAWFVLWMLANAGFLGFVQHFDEYPFDLLSIILAIEAVLITGFLLISQNYQHDYSEKRAELDYEISIRCYRKLLALEAQLAFLSERTDGRGPDSQSP